MIRAFVAIALPATVTRMLTAAQTGLPSGHPVAPENFHITLAFLGDNPGPLIEDMHLALGAIRAPAFALTLSGAGLFGGGRPRVLYADIQPEPGLKHLRRKVMQAVRGAGLSLPGARYHPHVTLARFNSGLTGEPAQEIREFAARRMDLTAGPFAVETFKLFRSRLGRKGPAYEVLAAYPLVGAPEFNEA